MTILTPLQKELLKAIGRSPLGQSYWWTGGTALAYRLKHRLSEDLDFFTETLERPEIFLARIKNLLKECGLKQDRYEERMNRHLFIANREKETIKLEFVYFPFPPLKKPLCDPRLNIRIDSPEEIAINKVLSAFQRKEPKDAYDLYILCAKKKLDLKKLTRNVQKKFGVSIDYGALLAKLVALSQNINQLEPLLLHKPKFLSKTMATFFQNEGNRYLRPLIR